MLYSVGDQGSYLVSLVNCGWSIWAASSKSVRVFTADGALTYRKEKIKRLEGDLKDAAAKIQETQAALEEARRDNTEVQAQVGRQGMVLKCPLLPRHTRYSCLDCDSHCSSFLANRQRRLPGSRAIFWQLPHRGRSSWLTQLAKARQEGESERARRDEVAQELEKTLAEVQRLQGEIEAAAEAKKAADEAGAVMEAQLQEAQGKGEERRGERRGRCLTGRQGVRLDSASTGQASSSPFERPSIDTKATTYVNAACLRDAYTAQSRPFGPLREDAH